LEIIEAIKKRKSIRKFKPDSVSKEVLKDILEIAGRAPSALNTQPWEFTVISGDILKNIVKGHLDKIKAGIPPDPEFKQVDWPHDSIYRDRQVGLAFQLFKLMGIEREDKKKRAAWLERGFRYFDAPAAILISLDSSIAEDAPLLDIGSIMQTICLAALSFSLGTCIENQGVMYPKVVRQFADIPESRLLVTSIAIGFPDWDFPANHLVSKRESVDNMVTWCGFN